jgi:tRNA U54 and U55 pseudouridine synthase Pus10
MPSEPIQRGKTHRVVVEIKGPVTKEKLVKFHKALKGVVKKVRGKVVQKRRRRKKKSR